MKLLINEPPLQILQSLTLEVGLSDAILLLQLYCRLCNFQNKRKGYKWGYKKYTEWKRVELPFWSVERIIRTIRKLENKGDFYLQRTLFG